MRKLLLASLLLLVCSTVQAQNFVYNDFVIINTGTVNGLRAGTYAVIKICSGITPTVPCAIAATIYNGPTTATTMANPFSADFNGNFTAWLQPGTYTVSITGNGIAGYNKYITVFTGGTGTVSNFSAGNLSPLFTTSVANSTTTPTLSFSLSTAVANRVFGNCTGGVAAPAYCAITTAMLPQITNALLPNPMILTALANNSTPFKLVPFSTSQSAPLLDIYTGIGSASCAAASLICFHAGNTSGAGYMGFIINDEGNDIFAMGNTNSVNTIKTKITNSGCYRVNVNGPALNEFDQCAGTTKFIDANSNAVFVLGPSGTKFQVDIPNGATRAGDNTLTVATLPAVALAAGKFVTVGDSTAVAAEGQVCVGGSVNIALAFSNGVVWKCF